MPLFILVDGKIPHTNIHQNGKLQLIMMITHYQIDEKGKNGNV